jgi:hypothetical protein
MRLTLCCGCLLALAVLCSVPSIAAGRGAAGAAPLPARSGAQLGAAKCRRCHNLRPPTSLSDDQWEVVVNHMRLRANLTATDARKILEFLKSAN